MTSTAKVMAVALTAMLLSASNAAAVGPEARCEARKNQESGKYAFCLHKAEARLLKTGGACSVTAATACHRDAECPPSETCVKDLTNYNVAVTKCEGKYAAKWNVLEQHALEQSATCPDEPLLQADVKAVIDDCVANVASGLAGDGLADCNGELATCNGSLSTCSSNLSTCDTNYSGCSSSLTTCNSNYSSCSSSLSTCNANYSSCAGSLATCNAGTATAADVLVGKTFSSAAGLGLVGTAAAGSNVNGADGSLSFPIPDALYSSSKTCTAADSDLLAANIRNGKNVFGVAGTAGLPRTAQITAFGPGSDGAVQAGSPLSYTDNGDGTVTDNVTGLMWEKKDDSGGIHDRENTYSWSLNSSSNNMDGTIVTTFLATLNAGAGFAGYTDWRIPNVRELQSILDYEILASGPVVNAAFHKPATCVGCMNVTAATCSCTASALHWSSTSRTVGPNSAWSVNFGDANINSNGKTSPFRARAVRGGL